MKQHFIKIVSYSYLILAISSFYFGFLLLCHWSSLNNLYYDLHSFRQSDTYAMIVLQYQKKASLFFPKYYQASDPANIHHYHLVEFPLYQQIVANLFDIIGEQIIVARIVNLVFTSILATAVFFIANKSMTWYWSFFAGLLLLIFPLMFFWSRAITPDILALSAFTCSVAILLYDSNHKIKLIIAGSLLAVSVLVKPYYFAFIPLQLYLLTGFARDYLKKSINLIFFFFLPIFLFFSWSLWVNSFPPEAKVHQNFNSLMHDNLGYITYLKGTNWPEHFIQRVFFGEVLTPLGGALAIAGAIAILFAKKKKVSEIALLYWFLGSLAISFVVSYGSNEHNYYLLHWLPPSAVFSTFALVRLNTLFCKYIEKLKGNIKFIFGLSTLGVAISVFVLFFLIPFKNHTEDFFGVSTPYYNLEQMEDYIEIEKIIPNTKQVVVFVPHQNPFPLNLVRKFGYVFGYENYLDCNEKALNDKLSEFKQLSYDYLMLYKHDGYVFDCLEKPVDSMLNNYFVQSVVYNGHYYNVYTLDNVPAGN